ncbi:SemiSWEET family sugar transporter [Segnochrobactraceae bacterium EtOH-i3]
MMPELATEAVGFAAAFLTTLCWVPQAIKILRSRDAAAISLITQLAFTVGIFLWLLYGFLLGRPSLIAANTVTFVLAAAILFLKLRFG